MGFSPNMVQDLHRAPDVTTGPDETWRYVRSATHPAAPPFVCHQWRWEHGNRTLCGVMTIDSDLPIQGRATRNLKKSHILVAPGRWSSAPEGSGSSWLEVTSIVRFGRPGSDGIAQQALLITGQDTPDQSTACHGGQMRQEKQRFLVAICALFIATLLTTSSAVAEGGCWECIDRCPTSSIGGDQKCLQECDMEEAEWTCVASQLCQESHLAILCTEEPE